jgi:uncharacterized protein (UPF0297 family)
MAAALGQAQGQVQPPAVAFALYPSALNNNAVLDYSQEADRKLFKAAIKGMETKFELQAGDLQVFLSKVKMHAQIYNFNDILTIDLGNNVTRNLIDRYGETTMAQVRTDAVTYVNNGSRKTQNSVMLYHYLVDSISENAKSELLASPEVFMVEDANGDMHVAGTTFLKAIIQKAYVDTKATVNSIRHAIARLDHKMEEVNSDIGAFNEYVKSLRNMLRSRGEDTKDIISHIFVGYAAASDQAFVAYMEEKRNQIEDEDVDMDLNEVMQRALNKYNILVQSKRWNAPDKKDTAIFALKSEIEELKKVKQPTNGPSGGQGGSDSRNAKRARKWAWKNVKPGPNDPKEKEFQKKKYYWCPNHEAWTAHKPEECKGKDFYRKRDQVHGESQPIPHAKEENKLKMAMALIMESENEDHDA